MREAFSPLLNFPTKGRLALGLVRLVVFACQYRKLSRPPLAVSEGTLLGVASGGNLQAMLNGKNLHAMFSGLEAQRGNQDHEIPVPVRLDAAASSEAHSRV